MTATHGWQMETTMMDIKVMGAKTAEDAAHAARIVFTERDATMERPAGRRHGAGYMVSVGGKTSHWLYCWRTKAGLICCALDYGNP